MITPPLAGWTLALLLGLGQVPSPSPPTDKPVEIPLDPFRLREQLRIRDMPIVQAQAALALVRHPAREAEAIVRQSLQQLEEETTFLALASAVGAERDTRYREDLIRALTATRPAVRQAAAEALSVLLDQTTIDRFKDALIDPRVATPTRAIIAWTLGRSGRKAAVEPLLLALPPESANSANSRESGEIREAVLEALVGLTGQDIGPDPGLWGAWWSRHKNLTNERWLELRLAHQASRIARLESELDATRNQSLRLHQDLYARQNATERLAYLPTLVEQPDPALRNQAAIWCAEALAVTEPGPAKPLGAILIRLSRDSDPTVARSACVGLGKVTDPVARDRLIQVASSPSVPLRVAALRGLAQQARLPSNQDATAKAAIEAQIFKSLEDPAIEVVVEAAEDLSIRGQEAAVPFLANLLRSPQEPVRKISAQALERVANSTAIEAILKAMDDPQPLVRFSLVGAMSHILGQKEKISATDLLRLQSRLEVVLLRDGDSGVRARAASAMGETGGPSILGILWRAASSAEDARVQDKAWAAMMEIMARAAQPNLVLEWDKTLSDANQSQKRLNLLVEMSSRWQKRNDAKTLLAPLQEPLASVSLEQGKWQTALGPLRELLSTMTNETQTQAHLRKWLAACNFALAEGNAPEALKLLREVEPLLGKNTPLAQQAQDLARKAKSP